MHAPASPVLCPPTSRVLLFCRHTCIAARVTARALFTWGNGVHPHSKRYVGNPGINEPPSYTADAPALFGFDETIDEYCSSHPKENGDYEGGHGHANNCIRSNLNILSLYDGSYNSTIGALNSIPHLVISTRRDDPVAEMRRFDRLHRRACTVCRNLEWERSTRASNLRL